MSADLRSLNTQPVLESLRITTSDLTLDAASHSQLQRIRHEQETLRAKEIQLLMSAIEKRINENVREKYGEDHSLPAFRFSEQLRSRVMVKL